MTAVQTGRCSWRGCGAAILWVRTERGKKMPLDPVPDGDRGTVLLTGENKVAKVFPNPTAARAYQFLHEGLGPYVMHGATCKGEVPAKHQRPAPRVNPQRRDAPDPTDPQMRLV